jgi:hypothetical protein
MKLLIFIDTNIMITELYNNFHFVYIPVICQSKTYLLV